MAAKAQMTLRGDVAHFQVGGPNNYERFNLPATDKIRAYFNAQMAAGNHGDSFANTSTQYVPVQAEKVDVPSWKVCGIEIVKSGEALN